jgi:hypothetical protein
MWIEGVELRRPQMASATLTDANAASRMPYDQVLTVPFAKDRSAVTAIGAWVHALVPRAFRFRGLQSACARRPLWH